MSIELANCEWCDEFDRGQCAAGHKPDRWSGEGVRADYEYSRRCADYDSAEGVVAPMDYGAALEYQMTLSNEAEDAMGEPT